MSIHIQETPNPQTLKFIIENSVILDGDTNITFNNVNECYGAPLAEQLLEIEGVISLFFSKDFISITKDNTSNWHHLKMLVKDIISDYIESGEPIFNSDVAVVSNDNSKTKNIQISDADNLDDEITKQIKEIIETMVRPAVAEDGGDIEFSEFKDGVVYVKLYGACYGCPSSTITLKDGIENMLKHYIPEVNEVVQVED